MLLVVVVVVVAVVLVLALIGLAAYHPSAPSGTPPTVVPPTRTLTIASSGTVYQLAAGHFEYLGPWTVPSAATVTGAFTATGGSGSNSFILTPDEQQAFGSSGSTTPSSYVWTSGAVATGSINTNLPAGTYYFDFVNQDSFSTTSVQVTSAVVASYST
jgi:hypothetical protein